MCRCKEKIPCRENGGPAVGVRTLRHWQTCGSHPTRRRQVGKYADPDNPEICATRNDHILGPVASVPQPEQPGIHPFHRQPQPEFRGPEHRHLYKRNWSILESCETPRPSAVALRPGSTTTTHRRVSLERSTELKRLQWHLLADASPDGELLAVAALALT